MTDSNMNEQEDLTGGLGRDRQPQQQESKVKVVKSNIDDTSITDGADDMDNEKPKAPSPYAHSKFIMKKTTPVEFKKEIYYKDEKGRYINDDNEFMKVIYKYSKVKQTRYVKEVLEQIKLQVKKVNEKQSFPIRLNNGILHKGKFKYCTYTDFTPYTLNYNYDPNAKPVSEVDEYLNHLSNFENEYRLLIEEIMGYILETDASFVAHIGKFFILVGDGGYGKGTFLKLIRALLDNKNLSALDIKQLSDPKYNNALDQKLANLGDDIQGQTINDIELKMLKNISTADEIALRKLFQDSYDSVVTSTLIFTSNRILSTIENDNSGAYERRVMWLPIVKEPTNKHQDFFDLITTQDAKKYLIKLMIEGNIRLHEQGMLTESKTVEKFNTAYHKKNVNVNLFVDEHYDKDFYVGKTTDEIREIYISWCNELSLKPLSKLALNKAIKNTLGLDTHRTSKTVDGKKIYTQKFKKIDEL